MDSGSRERLVKLPLALMIACGFAGTSAQAQNEAGDTLAVVMSPRFQRNAVPPTGPLDFGDPVFPGDYLITDLSDRLVLRLLIGEEVSIGPSTEIQLHQDEGNIGTGIVRVVEAPARPTPYAFKTPSGRAAGSTSFVIACGAPITPSNDDCLFVGIYGLTRVVSLAFPDQPVELAPRFFTRVRLNQLPDPPQPISETLFLQLIDLTTVIGTGGAEDRLGSSDAEAPLRPGPPRRLRRNPQEDTLDQPRPPQEGLPDPPPPPNPPPLIRGDDEPEAGS